MSFRRALCLLAAVQAAECLQYSHPLYYQKLHNKEAARAVAEKLGHPQVVFQGLDKGTKRSEENDQAHGYWYAKYNVGISKDLKLIINTVTPELELNPGVYQPTSKAENMGRAFRQKFSGYNLQKNKPIECSGHIYKDFVTPSEANLVVDQLAIGVLDSPPVADGYPFHGTAGFRGDITADMFKQKPYMYELCDHGVVSPCRFGISIKEGTPSETHDKDKTLGHMHFGPVPEELLLNPLVEVPLPERGQWSIDGHGLALNGEIVATKQASLLDFNIPFIFGPSDAVRALFHKAGMKVVEKKGAVMGYYPCEKPPRISFVFAGQPFEISPEALIASKDGNNCGANIVGTTKYDVLWIIGQPFFPGRYVDFNVEGKSLGFADLKK